jgi:hypothetical protein
MGLLPLGAPNFTASLLASPLTLRALGATLFATGVMQVAVGRAAGRGRLAGIGALVSLLGSALVGIGAAKMIWPSVSAPLSSAWGGRGGAVSLAVMGLVLSSVAIGVKPTPPP